MPRKRIDGHDGVVIEREDFLRLVRALEQIAVGLSRLLVGEENRRARARAAAGRGPVPEHVQQKVAAANRRRQAR